MATIASASFSAPIRSRNGEAGLFAELKVFWGQFFEKAFNPYRPELHYMRGPGPAWRAKHLANSRPHST
jgi:hypothetical protein